MRRDKTSDAQVQAFQCDGQPFQDPSLSHETEYQAIAQHYQSLYQDYHALLKRYPTKQEPYPDRAMFRQTLHDYRQSLHDHQQSIQQFRRTLRKLIFAKSSQSDQNSPRQADRPLLRTTILLGTGNAQEAAFLKAYLQQAHTHRVFLAADNRETLGVLHNVHIDVLILDEELNPLSGSELYHHLHCLKKRLPTIIMSDSFRFLRQLERIHSHFIGLEKPVRGDALLKAIDQLLA